jgi:hypothetical protein
MCLESVYALLRMPEGTHLIPETRKGAIDEITSRAGILAFSPATPDLSAPRYAAPANRPTLRMSAVDL